VRDGEAKRITIDILQSVLAEEHLKDAGVRLWDGSLWPDERPRPTTVVLKHPGSLRAMFVGGTEVVIGEAYMNDDYDIEGNVEDIFTLADSLRFTLAGWKDKAAIAPRLLKLPVAKSDKSAWQRNRARLSGKKHSVERNKQAVAFHYNASNDFFRLWLDKNMVYSCAYFASPEDDLDQAQINKIDYICRKLRLKPGQKLLDIGCGWGALVMHAVKYYGVDATGITLSSAQVELATERIAQAGLADRCRVLLKDYREIDEPEQYDALSSVGMFEHVGTALLPTYFAQALKLLRPGGVFLNHGIALSHQKGRKNDKGFVATYIFPDGETVPINATLRAAEESGFEVRDVENLREHYARTLRHWLRRLENNHDEALKYVDEPTYRAWRLYMAGAVYGFDIGALHLCQSLLVKTDARGASGLPMTRADWYRLNSQPPMNTDKHG
jgi:cyclopropane-fatty-acyl-phospholipid synthase